MKKIDLKRCIRNIPDFPKAGILFKDITTLLKDAKAFKYAVEKLAEKYKGKKIDAVLSVESRGFIFGSAIACLLGAGLVPIRKKGKLPFKTYSISYDLEYGKAGIEIHQDALQKGSKVLLVDDVLATGGTVEAATQLVEKLGGDIRGIYFLIELLDLKGRKRLKDYTSFSLISF